MTDPLPNILNLPGLRRVATPAELRRNIALSLSRGYPEIRPAPPQLGTLHIVANGPSAAQFFDQRRAGPTLALNGALSLFRAHGAVPTFWACADPQAHMTRYLDDPPRLTHYLVASQCHPALFRALKGRDVALWHSHDAAVAGAIGESRPQVTGGVSVTSRALNLAHMMGWQRIEVWGWDCCRLANRAHAVVQELPDQGRCTIHFPGRDGPEWDTSDVWLLELAEAVQQIRAAPYHAVIHGPGLLAAVLDHNDGARHVGNRAA